MGEICGVFLIEYESMFGGYVFDLDYEQLMVATLSKIRLYPVEIERHREGDA